MLTNKFKRYLYSYCSKVFTQVQNICFTGSLRNTWFCWTFFRVISSETW